MSIDITEAAAKYLLRFAKEKPVRLRLKTTRGCGDFSPHFDMGVDIIPIEGEDVVLEKYGLMLICNLEKLPKLDGATVDLHEDVKDRSKVIFLRSPKLESCGCGQAVTPKKE